MFVRWNDSVAPKFGPRFPVNSAISSGFSKSRLSTVFRTHSAELDERSSFMELDDSEIFSKLVNLNLFFGEKRQCSSLMFKF